MMHLYLDTSSINHLYDDPRASALIAALKSKTQPLISIFTFVEIASTPDAKRRIALLTFVRDIAGKYRPFAFPGDLLRRSLEQIHEGASEVNISIGSEHDGVWVALNEPSLIKDDAYKEVVDMKCNEERWYQSMHNSGRPEIQEVLTKHLPKEHRKLSFSKLVKYFVSSSDFINMIHDIAAPSGARIEIDDVLLHKTLNYSEHWRYYLAGMAYGLYARSAKINDFGKNTNPGSVDTQQAIYLADCDAFVTADRQQYRMLRLLIPFGLRKREIWNYSALTSWLLP